MQCDADSYILGARRVMASRRARIQKSASLIEDMTDWIPGQVTIKDVQERNKGVPNDDYYHNILVGGANAAGRGILGLSEMPFGALANGGNYELFRNGEVQKIRAAIDAAIKAGKHPRVVGHSWGGSTVANIAKDYPDVPFYALDPVSWTHRLKELPKNLTVYRPKTVNSLEHDTVLSMLAGTLGGRWPEVSKGEGRTVKYVGGHVNGLDEQMNRMMWNEWKDRMHPTQMQMLNDNIIAAKGTPAPSSEAAGEGS